MCKTNDETARSSSECCFNHYFNGSTCLDCTAGFTGLNCSDPCIEGSYGVLCSSKCNCTKIEICNPINGCEPGSTVTSAGNVPGPEGTLNNNNSTCTILFVIGSVIGLFLGIFVIQMCVKILTSRKKRRKRESSKKHDLVQEQETYQESNEEIMVTSKRGDHEPRGKFKKYYELKSLNCDTAVKSCQNLETEFELQELGTFRSVTENNLDLSSSSTRSDSTKSTTHI